MKMEAKVEPRGAARQHHAWLCGQG